MCYTSAAVECNTNQQRRQKRIWIDRASKSL